MLSADNLDSECFHLFSTAEPSDSQAQPTEMGIHRESCYAFNYGTTAKQHTHVLAATVRTGRRFGEWKGSTAVLMKRECNLQRWLPRCRPQSSPCRKPPMRREGCGVGWRVVARLYCVAESARTPLVLKKMEEEFTAADKKKDTHAPFLQQSH